MSIPHGVTGFCFFWLFMLCLTQATALMFGQSIDGAPVVQLVFEHRQWHEHRQAWDIRHSECSAVIVGNTPLTLITAAHCLRDVSLDQSNGLPLVKITQAGDSLLLDARLSQAVFPEFDKVRGNLIDDLAVLVFDRRVADSMAIAPVLLDQAAHTALLCGYGFGVADTSVMNLRCARKELHTGNESFAAFVPSSYETLDPLFYTRYRTQFESKANVVSALDALLAVNRLNSSGYYDPTLPMPTLGDSGGPWLEEVSPGQYAVVGVTSFVESFYGSSPQWPFFRQSTAPMADFVYVAYGIRLDTMRARKLFNAARLKGADIRVYRREWRDNTIDAISSTTNEIRR